MATALSREPRQVSGGEIKYNIQMIDKLVAARSVRKHSEQDKNYRPDKAFLDRELFNQGAPRLTVVFPPWHGTEQLSATFKKRATKRGSALLLYSLHGQILSANVTGTVESFHHIQRVAAEDIDSLVEQYGYNDVHLMSYSLGTVALALTASKLKSNFRATCVVGGSNLAGVLWDGIRTQDVRRGIEAQDITEGELETAWSGITPDNNLANFEDKNVHLILSKSDKTVPYKYQLELAAKFEEVGADLTVDHNRSGHVMSVVNHTFFGDY